MEQNPSIRVMVSRIKKLLLAGLLLGLVLFPDGNKPAKADTVTFSTPGTSNFTVPAGVTSITVQAWGGGGAGGAGLSTTNKYGGGGGAGGQYATKVLTVTPGATYAVVVGAGGTTTAANGNKGGNSTFNSTAVVAVGGNGGLSYSNGRTGGAGSTTGGVGTTVYAGGNGAAGATTYSGAGGGGAGTGGAGGNATTYTAGTGRATNGGNGGAGSTANIGNGGVGNNYGGGGGGATRSGVPGAGGPGLVLITYTVPTYTLTYLAGDNGTITGTTPQTVAAGGMGTEVTASPKPGYHFLRWSDGSTTNPRTDKEVSGNITVTAEFEIDASFTLLYDATVGGSISGTATQYVSPGGSGTAVTAVANTGYHFVRWSDNGSTANPRTDTNVSANISATAVFELDQFTLTYSPGTGGYLSGTTPQTVSYGGSGTAVQAVANTGYTFTQWSDGSTANPRTDTNVTANKSVTAQFTLNTYTLTYTAGANGTLSGTSPQTVSHGGNGTAVTANPNTGYHFVNWSDGSTSNPRTDTNVTTSKSVTANFAINTYTLTYAAGSNGTITGSTTQTVNHGSNGTAVTASPSAGYHFAQWSDGSTSNPRTDLNITANLSVTANFAINTYTLTYTAGAGGSITGTSPQTVNHGANGTAVTAVATTGYTFTQWSDGQTSNPRTDTNVTANKSVTAQFTLNTYTLTYTAGSNGTLTGSTTQTVSHGSNGTAVTAVPNANYTFSQWSDGNTSNPRTDLNVTANKSVSASFTAVASNYTLTYTAGANGTLTGSTTQTVASGGNGTAVTANPNTGYHFVDWSDGNTSNPRTDINVTANKSVTANFAINVYTLLYDAGTGGSLTGTATQYINYGGNGTTVTAVPSAGYHFVQWSDGNTSASRSETNVTSNKSFTAQFAINTYTLTYTAGSGGSITGTTTQTVNHGSSGTAVTATPSTGYRFVQWSDGSTSATRTESNVTSNQSYSATFAILTYTLTYTAGSGGSITGTSTQTVNHGANGTAVTATPSTGYRFVQWSDGSTSATRTETNVTSNKSFSASFAILTYTLTYAAGANGTLTGSTSQTVNHGSNGTAVTAVPNANYSFSQWSDGLTTNPRTDLNVTANKSVTASFSAMAANYTLTYTAGPNGSLTGSTTQTVVSGGSGTAVTANAAANYHFVNWSDGSTANPRTDTNVTSNRSVTANFAINTYTLLYDAGVGGSLTGTTTQYVNHGANGTTVTAVPSTGYHFVQWSDGITTAARTETNVTSNKSFTAQFAINTYTLTYSAGANGTLSGASPQTVNHGASGTPVTAIPSTNYRFVQWSDGSMANPRTDINVTANKTVTASFALETFKLIYLSEANGRLTGTTTQEVSYNGSGTAVTAVPDSGYSFSTWSDGLTANPRTDINVTANVEVSAKFSELAATYTLTYAAGANGTISGTSPQTVPAGENGTEVQAVPNANYHFVNWSDGFTDAWRIDKNVTANKSVTANFAIDVHTLIYDAGTGGYLSGTSIQFVNHGANGTAVQAIANTGYSFVRWSDGVTANPRTDTNVQTDKSVSAVFALNNLTLTYTAGANGTISGASPQSVPYGGNGTAVTANPNAGYRFTQWSDGVTSNPRTDTNVTASKTVSATFASNTYTLTYVADTNGTLTGTTTQTVNYGGNGTAVQAVANTGYHFVQWSDGSTANPRTDSNVVADASYTATFTADTFTLTYTAGANGTISGQSPQTISYGDNGSSVQAVPNANYNFAQWSDGRTDNPRIDVNVTANKSVTAQFSAAASTYTLTYQTSGNGTINGANPQTVSSGGSGSAVTASPDQNFHFVQWSDGRTDNPRTDTNVTANKTVTATFAIDTYTVMYDAGVGGSLSGTAVQYVGHGGNGTPVTAVGNAGYHFTQWSDGSTANPRTESNVTANKSVTASFGINSYTLNYSAGTGGSISGTVTQTVTHGGNGTAVTAVPAAEYQFTEWSDGLTTASRTDTNVTSAKNLTANFTKPGVNNNSISGGTNAFKIGSFSGGLIADIPLKLKYTSYTAVPGSEIFNDKTPYSNNAQNYGATALATELVFDGSNDYVTVASNPSLQVQTNLTLSAWVKPNAAYTGDVILIGTSAYYLTVGSDWSFKTYWYGKSAPGYHSSGAGTLVPGQWNFITAVWSASDVKLYVNGILKNTVNSTGTGTNAGQIWIGAETGTGTRAFKGSIANVKLFNKALTADEVDDIYSQGLEESAFMLSGQN